MDQLGPRPANSTPLTPLGLLDRAAVAYAESASIVYNDTVYTWADTRRRCVQIASSLSSIGIGRRHVVSILAPNVPAIYEVHFAVPMSGAVLNSINTRLDSRTVSVILRHSESKLVFVDFQSFSLLAQAFSLLPPDHPCPKVVLIEDEGSGSHGGGLKGVDKVDVIATYEEMVRKGDPGFDWVRPGSDWDPIVLNYTSGTTSSPKGVVHSHRGAFVNVMNGLIDWGVSKRPVYLWTLPMFHSNGWGYTWGTAAVGATSICLRKFDAATIYAAINRHHVTHMCGAPVVLNMLSNLPNAAPLSSPVRILTAGAPPPAEVLRRTEALGFIVSHGYGLTETGGLVVSCEWKPHWDKLPAGERAKFKARQGVRTVAAAEVEVINPDTGKPVTRDGKSVGEIVIRGGFLMLGYLKDPEATSKCMESDGWFKTGDVGVIHPDGYLEIKDRSKDIIISGGENISSVEVESALYGFPGVNEAAVVARPDEYWGETPCAFVSFKEGVKRKATEREVIEFCKERLPHYMVPKTVVFKDELPKTSTGKIQKVVLREIAKNLGPSIRSSRL